MGYWISKIELTNGEECDLSSNTGFMQRVTNLSSHWRELREEFGLFTNDFKILPVNFIRIEKLEKDIENIKNNPDGRSNDDVKDYLRRVIKLVKECKKDEDKGFGLVWG